MKVSVYMIIPDRKEALVPRWLRASLRNTWHWPFSGQTVSFEPVRITLVSSCDAARENRYAWWHVNVIIFLLGLYGCETSV